MNMTPLIPCSTTNIVLLVPRTSCCYGVKKKNCSTTVTRYSSTNLLFPLYRRKPTTLHQSGFHLVVSAVAGTDIAVADETAETSESNPSTTQADPAQASRSRPVRLTIDQVVPGATFTGKVRSVQPFGAFVDFGAFTDGLVHVSNLSNSFVKDVGSFVTVGQEVKVRVLDVSSETKRISLSMRDESDAQPKDVVSGSSEKSRPPRRNPSQKKNDFKSSKFVKGQELQGTVKNLNRAGAFISLPDGEEGFLPTSEESDSEMLAIMGGGSSLQAGQDVTVRVLRITRGQVTLTMKTEDVGLDPQLSQGVVHVDTNPFLLAFRKNKDIAAFLDDRDKAAKQPVETQSNLVQTQTISDIPEILDETTENDQSPSNVTVSDAESVNGEEEAQAVEKESETEGIISDMNPLIEESPSTEEVGGDETTENDQSPSNVTVSDAESVNKEAQVVEKESETEGIISDMNPLIEESPSTDEVGVENQLPTSESPGIEQVVEDKIQNIKDELQIEAAIAESETPSASTDGDAIDVPDSEENRIPDSVEDQTISSESQVVQGNEVQIQTPSAEDQIPSSSTGDGTDEDGPKEHGNTSASNGQSTSIEESVSKASISPALVKQLREETGAGMMDCKNALSETEGDIIKAQEFLRKKGLASADKKASRATAEGRIGSYIHDSRIGVLIEVNCETDFVSRGDIFRDLVDDLAMQVAASPQVEYLATEDVPEELVNKERDIEMQKEDLLSRPEQIRSKIVDGRIRKRLEELALLEQPYIKNDKMVVKDLVKQTIATIGENIKVKRFVRYNLGEGLEKKSQDFAAEVAAQTSATSVSSPAKEQPTAVEAIQKTSATAVSAALVKQLREETGAGMMDCKKALSETGGDLEKAQEYLRKKGLSSADKKSSRLAAEGRIGYYIHDSRIGVLIEVNCETDFVGRSEKFKELVDDLAMQVVASPQVKFVSMEDIPESIVENERKLEMQREDLMSKPDNIREKIVEGRMSKRLGELALLEQPFIKDDGLLVKDLVKQSIAAIGENIKVRRFTRFTLGETAET